MRSDVQAERGSHMNDDSMQAARYRALVASTKRHLADYDRWSHEWMRTDIAAGEWAHADAKRNEAARMVASLVAIHMGDES